MKQQDLLFLFGSVVSLVVVWILFNLYHNSVTTTVSKEVQIKIDPIAPDFDTQTIQSLKTRLKVSPIFDIPTPIATSAIQPTIQAIPNSTESAKSS